MGKPVYEAVGDGRVLRVDLRVLRRTTPSASSPTKALSRISLAPGPYDDRPATHDHPIGRMASRTAVL